MIRTVDFSFIYSLLLLMSGCWAIDQKTNRAIQVPATIEWQEPGVISVVGLPSK